MNVAGFILTSLRNILPLVFFSFFLFLTAAFSFSEMWVLCFFFAFVMLFSAFSIGIVRKKQIRIQWHNRPDLREHNRYVFTLEMPATFLSGKGEVSFILGDEEYHYLLISNETKYLFDASDLPRGRHNLSLMRVAMKDWIGLFKRHLTLHTRQEILVLPKAREREWDEAWTSTQELLLAARGIAAEKSYDLKELRDYQSGDAFHSIHWKLSQRRQVLTVKELEVERKKDWLFLFLGGSGSSFEEMLALYYTSYLRSSEGKFWFVGMTDDEGVQLVNHPVAEDFAKAQAFEPQAFRVADFPFEELNQYLIVLFASGDDDALSALFKDQLAERNDVVLIKKEKNQLAIVYRNQKALVPWEGGRAGG